jgi:hypothetical protein
MIKRMLLKGSTSCIIPAGCLLGSVGLIDVGWRRSSVAATTGHKARMTLRFANTFPPLIVQIGAAVESTTT